MRNPKTTVLRLVACGHEIKVRDWLPSPTGPHRADLDLDGFSVVVMGIEHMPLLMSMAKNLAYALRAPERKKRRAPPALPESAPALTG